MGILLSSAECLLFLGRGGFENGFFLRCHWLGWLFSILRDFRLWLISSGLRFWGVAVCRWRCDFVGYLLDFVGRFSDFFPRNFYFVPRNFDFVRCFWCNFRFIAAFFAVERAFLGLLWCCFLGRALSSSFVGLMFAQWLVVWLARFPRDFSLASSRFARVGCCIRF